MQDLADRLEWLRLVVGVNGQVAIDRVVAGDRGRALVVTPRAQGVVREDHAIGVDDIVGLMVSLAIGSHDLGIAADGGVGGEGAAAAEGERTLAGEHHRLILEHDQHALVVTEHRGFGIPVGLGTHVDAIDDDDHLATALGEMHDARHDCRAPVHVFGAGVPGDPGSCRKGDPLNRHL